MRRKGHFFRILLTAVLLLGLLPLNIWAAEGQSAGEATVLFTHDLHSCFFPRVQEGEEERGGFARLAAALTEERTGHPDALTVDAGDFSSGSLVQTLSTTRAPELVTLGAMGYDAVTAGNHEFDNGPLGFGEMLTAAGRGSGALPALVMANYRPAEDDPNRLDLQRAMAAYGVQEYLLLERGGVTYGIFGLMGQDAHASTPTSSFVLEDPAQAAQRPLQSLRKNAAPAATLLQLQQGDMVEHTAFGKGMVLSVRPMGGDALAEVAFDTVGKKKLMLKSAGAHMRKL